jgi:predicted small lipoprotein YifL
MILRLLLAFALVLAVPACGVKSELLMPNGKSTPKTQKDPSQPPQPIGR